MNGGRPSLGRGAALILLVALALPALAHADGGRVLRFRFQPTARAQIALWLETAEGEFLGTVRLTQATSYRGIGNRPGAYAMNSGFRWPYGRREGVLPVWAHRRAAAPGASPFRRVIFQDRLSEGRASRTSDDFSEDKYYCLSFQAATTRRDALDAVTCASVFNSDKGRYLAAGDVADGYSEPIEDEAGARMRALSVDSLYPPRRDAARCTGGGCYDHADVARFGADAKAVMPDLDAVTMATPAGGKAQEILFDVPADWPTGDYVAWLEVNTEGDYSDTLNDDSLPTPTGPSGQWDTWAMNYGYAYRGQPSAVFRVPFSMNAGGETFSVDAPHGAGSVDGASGSLSPPDVLVDAPEAAPGSGADRLWRNAGSRFSVEVVATQVCAGDDAPAACGMPCSGDAPCPAGFLCGLDETCTGFCDEDRPPATITDLRVEPHPNAKHGHQWGVISFTVPDAARPLSRFDVRVSTGPMASAEDFEAALPANAASLDSVALEMPLGEPGTRVEADFGGLSPETTYHVGVRAIDACNDQGAFEAAPVTTTAIHFTTVSPCFIATAAYGSPTAPAVNALRRLRDERLMPHALGRAVVRAYYAASPSIADAIRARPWARDAVRGLLLPVLRALAWLDGGTDFARPSQLRAERGAP